MEKPFDNSLRIIYAEHKTVISDFLTNCFINNKYLDVIFICKNNVCVQSHKAVLISVSEYVKKIVHNCVDEIIFISLPDFDSSVVEVFVNFLYEGCTEINLQELCYFKELLTVLDVRLVNCELKPFSSVSKEVDIDVENQNTVLNGHTEHVETAWCLQVSSDTNFPDSYGLASSFNRTCDILTESSSATNETYKASFSCITDGIHCENFSSKRLPNIQSIGITTKAAEECHINLSSEEVSPVSQARDEESFAPIIGISSDVGLQTPYSFTSNGDSHSNGNLDLMQYFPSYKEDNDSNKKTLEKEMNVTSFSLEEIYSDTVQEKKDACIKNATSVAEIMPDAMLQNVDYAITDIVPHKETKSNEKSNIQILEAANYVQTHDANYDNDLIVLSDDDHDNSLINQRNSKQFVSHQISTCSNMEETSVKGQQHWSSNKNFVKKKYLQEQQSSLLKKVYKDTKYPSKELFTELCKTVKMSEKALRKWFGKQRELEKKRLAAGIQCSRKWRKFSKKELSILENVYNERKYLDEESISKLTKVIKVSRVKLVTWFNNRRQKDRYLAATKRTWRLGQKEWSMLENVYKERKYLNEESIAKLTKALGISSLKLRQWFNNRRLKDSHLKIMPDAMLQNVDNAITDIVPHKETKSNEKSNIQIPEAAYYVQTHDADYDNDLIVLSDDDHDNSLINQRNSKQSPSDQISATCSNMEETSVKGQQHWSSNKNFVKKKYLQEHQRSVLKKVYKDTKYPSKELFTELCKTVKMSEKALRKWFGKQRELEKKRLARAQKSKHVWNLSLKQYSMIESVYKEKKYLDEKSKGELTKALGISKIDLVAWFCRRRLRDRLKKKSSRRKLSKEETSVLENFYTERNCLDEESLAELTKTLGMTKLQLITWFKIRQQKDNHLNSSEQNSSFYNSEESRAVDNLQVFQSISTDEQSLSNEMTTEDNVDANDLSPVKTYIDTLEKNESICIEDDKILDAVPDSSEVLQRPNSSLEELKTVDKSENYEFQISNNEQYSSNEMTMVEEKDLNFLSPEKIFMDTFEGCESICTEDKKSLDTVLETIHDDILLNAITDIMSHEKKKSNEEKNIHTAVDAGAMQIHNLASNDNDDDDVILLSDDDQDNSLINERCLVNKESLDHTISTIYSNMKETSIQGTSEAHDDASQKQGSSVSYTKESHNTQNFEISNSFNEDRNSSHIMEIKKEEDLDCFSTDKELVDAHNTEITRFKDKNNLNTVAGMEEFVSLLINTYKGDAGHEGEKTTYECDTCKKLFSMRKGLIKHIDSAHNNIRYKCSHCRKLFKSCSDMTEHIDSIHNNIGYKCSYCQKVLKTHAGMKRHINTIHIYTSSYNTPS